MKPKTVILLVICGSLLLLVGVFAVFFARGGEVLVKMPYNVERYSSFEFTADEGVVDAMVGLDFTFEPTPGLIAHFQGINKQIVPVYHTKVTNDAVEHYVEERFNLGYSLQLNGNLLHAIPSAHYYTDLTQEDFYNQLLREIKLRINQQEATIDLNIPEFDFWGNNPNQLKKLPTK